MSRTETALKPFVANNSSAAGSPRADSVCGWRLSCWQISEALFVLSYKRYGLVNKTIWGHGRIIADAIFQAASHFLTKSRDLAPAFPPLSPHHPAHSNPPPAC